ncbi:MAG TPA: BON domain-containing protein [Candidatus Dormibacteraeota bacterium]|nr:BON domain-containing protein [Candidatus Dormibacteraeota bacterium]
MSTRSTTRSARRRDFRWWASLGVIASLAAGMAYLFDPEEGRGRRIRMSQQTAHVLRHVARNTARRLRYMSKSWLGHRFAGRQPAPVEGPTLLDRVHSEVFTNPAVPHGKLTFDVAGTTVVLRGQLDSQEQIDTVIAAVRSVAGVGRVKSFLHLPGTPAPNKAVALGVRPRAAVAERWPEEPPPDVDSEDALAVTTTKEG